MINGGATLTVGGAIGGAGFGLIKDGVGTLALSGSSGYSGPTSIVGGTLSLTGAGAINSSSGITVNGGSLLQTSTAAITPAVALTAGTVDGTTTINTVNVANNAAAVVAHGNGTVNPITIGSLNFSGAGTVSIITSTASQATPKIATTSLSTSAAGNVVITANNTAGIWNAGTYALMSYSGAIGGAGFAQFVSGQFVGLSSRQTVDLTNVGGVINAVIGGDTLVWTGALNGQWATAAQASPKNWKLSVSGAATDFSTLDAVTFNDSATTGNVNITGNVFAAGVQFANTAALPYTVSSSGGFGITNGIVSINGGGSVTITNNNTYAGGTVLNNGTLNINSGGTASPAASAIGTGPLTITGGTLDNTSGGNVTLATANAQNWNGDFTFKATSDLKFTRGDTAANPQLTNNAAARVTLGGTGTSRTVTVAAGQLTVGPIGSSGTLGLTKAGPGTLTIDSTSSTDNGAQSNIGGVLNVTDGLLRIGLQGASTGSDLNAGGLAGSGTIENGSNQTRWIILNQPTDQTFSGVLQDGTGGAGWV